MSELRKVVASAGSVTLSLGDLLRALHRRRRRHPLLLEALAERLVLDAARQAGLSVSQQEVQQAADRFRHRYGLTTALGLAIPPCTTAHSGSAGHPMAAVRIRTIPQPSHFLVRCSITDPDEEASLQQASNIISTKAGCQKPAFPCGAVRQKPVGPRRYNPCVAFGRFCHVDTLLDARRCRDVPSLPADNGGFQIDPLRFEDK